MIKEGLRTYKIGSKEYEFYKNQHTLQTYDSVSKKIKEYKKLNNAHLKIHDVLNMMNEFIDPSDPDVVLPNIVHAYQTAERIRKKYPLNQELQVTGLIHDLGKILFKFGEKPEFIVGDTFVLGCKFPDKIVFSDTFKSNPDYHNPVYSTENGIYREGIGIKNLLLSYGHDEYLYQVLNSNKTNLSAKYKDIIRFHSFYPWHTEKCYLRFMNGYDDQQLMEDILEFNQFDLYSKEDDDFVLTQEKKDYYNKLLDVYFPKKMYW
jgi:inositol oxygenase